MTTTHTNKQDANASKAGRRSKEKEGKELKESRRWWQGM